MVTLVCPPGTESYLEQVSEALLSAELDLFELPAAVASLYYLGESSLLGYLRQAEADADRYYQAASRGTFTAPLKPQGSTYAELCRARGEHAKADQVEADLLKLTFQLGGGKCSEKL